MSLLNSENLELLLTSLSDASKRYTYDIDHFGLKTVVDEKCMWTGKRVGRVTKLQKPEVVQAEVDARSIAANPFPYTITMEEVETFFKQYGQVFEM